jgi:hypothetical protein
MSQSWRAFVLMGLFIQSMASPALGVIDQKLLDDLANDTTDLFVSETIGPRIQDNIPLVSSSSAFTFRWDSELEVWQRSERTSGGIFLERAEPARERQDRFLDQLRLREVRRDQWARPFGRVANDG